MNKKIYFFHKEMLEEGELVLMTHKNSKGFLQLIGRVDYIDDNKNIHLKKAYSLRHTKSENGKSLFSFRPNNIVPTEEIKEVYIGKKQIHKKLEELGPKYDLHKETFEQLI